MRQRVVWAIGLTAWSCTIACGGCHESRSHGQRDSGTSGPNHVTTDAGDEPDRPDGATDAEVSVDVTRADADTSGPTIRQVDPEFLAALPTDSEGDPTLFSGPAALGEGATLELAIGEPAADPIGYWATCLELALSCQRGDDFDDGCVNAIPVCASPEGGLDCCTERCKSEFALDARRRPAKSALRNLLTGRCMDGLAEYVSEFGPMEPVVP